MFYHKEHEGFSQRTQRHLKCVSRKEREENAKIAEKRAEAILERIGVLVIWWRKIRGNKCFTTKNTKDVHEGHEGIKMCFTQSTQRKRREREANIHFVLNCQ